MIEPWPSIASQPLMDFRIFRVRRDRKVSPRTGEEHDFFVLDCPDWVNVVAITTDQRILLIEQYRHGTNTVELEIPGGVMDPEDANPVATGVRELREETGYEGVNARVIAQVSPNPAFMSNTCFTVLVEGCQPKHPLEFDQAEEITTRLAPLTELAGLMAAGRIRHSLVLVALYHYLGSWSLPPGRFENSVQTTPGGTLP